MAKIVGVIHKDKKSHYGVSYPDFPGCITAGRTLQEAYDMAAEALQGHIDVMAEYGDPFPSRFSTLDDAELSPPGKGAEAFFVVEAELPQHCKRINITLDERLLARIDKVTSNRSGFLAEAAREKLRQQPVT